MSDEAEFHQVKGVLEGIQQKPGSDWTEFSINIGRQYPVRLSTKQPDIIALANAAGTNEAVWTYKQTQGGPNPHKPGEFFQNRYLSKVEVGGVLDPAMAQQTAAAKSPAGGRTDVERGSIERQTIVKAAMPVYQQFADDDLFFAFLDRLSLFVAGSPVVVPEAVTAAPVAAAAAPVASGGSQLDPDSDIPFMYSVF